MDNSSKLPIEEGKIVSTSLDQTLDNSATINSLILQVETARTELAKVKDLLDNIFANDPTYQLHEKAVKDAQKVKNQTKKQLMKLSQALDLSNQLADKKAYIKELQQSLSDYLQEYSRSTGFTTFESDAGELLEIVVDYHVRKISK